LSHLLGPSFSRLAQNWRLRHIGNETQNNSDDIFADAQLNSNRSPKEFSSLLFLKTIQNQKFAIAV